MIVGVLAVTRATRFFTKDSFPTWVWIRDKIGHGTWRDGLDCCWCVAPWLALVDTVWAVVWSLGTIWWIVNLTLGAAYIASRLVESE